MADPLHPDVDPLDLDAVRFDFAPVPSRRHDGWTLERQQRFTALLATHGRASAAARVVGMASQTADCLRPFPGTFGTFARRNGRLGSAAS